MKCHVKETMQILKIRSAASCTVSGMLKTESYENDNVELIE